MSSGIKTHGDPLRTCLIFFHMTKFGASLSDLDNLFPVGSADNQHHVHAELPAVSGRCVPWGCVVSALLSGRTCLKSLCITVESDRHGVTPLHTLSTGMDSVQEGTQFPSSYSARDCSESPNFLLGSRVQESKRIYEPANVFQEQPWHINCRLNFLKSMTCSWYKEKMKQCTVKSQSPSPP